MLGVDGVFPTRVGVFPNRDSWFFIGGQFSPREWGCFANKFKRGSEMKKTFGIFVLFVVVRLYSGGVCVAKWETDNVDHRSGRIVFVDNATDRNIQVSGCFTVERINNVEKGLRWR